MAISPKLTDAKLATQAMVQAMLGLTSEAHGCATPTHTCGTCSPYLPKRSGYDKRVRKTAELIRCATRMPARDTTLWSL
ncbi:hypothetical protein [Streptomyces sp. SID1034]|uniref:hypothetical protein n=1 Tax=Streptomyces sp. SID1034 TaxID=2690248 RepID=UPI001F247B88|nr:hypothetical protein [Streptomyces sp. SID1034]